MLTLLEIIKRTTEFFAGKGIEHPRLNAELLAGHALGLERMQLYLQFERPLTAEELEKTRRLVRRRGQREPLQYILGETDFFGLKIRTDRRALIPRPETELLVERIVTRLAAAPPADILDLGTGTGAIALALATAFPGSQVLAVDRSAAALALARENAGRTEAGARVQWLESNWCEAVPAGARFGLIVANPPYLTAAEVAEAAPEVREFEPGEALIAGGANGLDDLCAIAAQAPAHLVDGGLLALETGIAQHAALLECLARAGLTNAESRADLSGRDRFVFATK